MKRRNMMWSLIVFFILIFGNSAVVQAVPTLTVSKSGKGQFVVQGTGLEEVAGMEVVIQYDKTTLTNPRVVQGGMVSSSLMVTNTNELGKVRLATVEAYPKTLSGAGTIATINFDSPGNSTANIAAINAKIVDVKGSQLPVQATIVSVPDSPAPAPTAADTTSTAGTTSAAGGSSPVWLGGVSMPAEATGVGEKAGTEPAAPTPEPENIRETTASTAEKESVPPTSEPSRQTASPEKQAVENKNVLDQFRVFKGEKTAKNLIAIFTRLLEGNRQEPPVALADGKSTVKVFVDIPSTAKTAPNFALKGAGLVSLKKSGSSTWAVEVLPSKGTFEASVTVLLDETMRQIPLTVAPPLPAGLNIGEGGKLTEADFNLYLKERGTDKAPRFDLNGDGKRDYIDDYIFTANFMVKQGAGKKLVEKAQNQPSP